MRPSLIRHLLLLFLAFLALVPGANATWSIVAVNRRTGEVCISSVTCIPRQDLTEWTPILLVGVGGGVTQSLLDDGSNKLRILDGFLAGSTPQAIMQRIRAEDSQVATRQIGIVDLVHDPLSFTGGQCGQARKSIAGSIGDVVYAIQGNVLASQNVIVQAEVALRGTDGDLGQRVLAGMVRARQLGGDGRCSCIPESLGDCGVPPADFQKSGHIGYFLLARVGDPDGAFPLGASDASGDYYLRLNIHGPNGLHESPDPVDQMVALYAAWRAARAGRPDGILSRAHTVDSLPADGVTERTVTVELVDLEGEPLDHGGALLEVTSADGTPLHATPGPVSDHGDGTYTFPLKAGTTTGVDRLAIKASDDLVHATLYPYLAVRSDPPAMLHAGRDRISATAPEDVPFVVNEPGHPGGKYWLFASLAGRKLRGSESIAMHLVVPGHAPFFPAPPGALDPSGRGEALYTVPPGVLVPLIGLRLEWTARLFVKGPAVDSNVVGFDIGQ